MVPADEWSEEPFLVCEVCQHAFEGSRIRHAVPLLFYVLHLLRNYLKTSKSVLVNFIPLSFPLFQRKYLITILSFQEFQGSLRIFAKRD